EDMNECTTWKFPSHNYHRRRRCCHAKHGDSAVRGLTSPMAAYLETPSTPATMQMAGPTQGPSHCVQKANNPHRSKHKGWMSAEVTASCRAKVTHMYHTAQLWENRWWGGEEIGVPDKFDETRVDY